MNSFVILIFAVVIVLLVVSVVIASFGVSGLWGAPYVGTPTGIVRRMIILGGGKHGETLLDLGSGAGNVLIVAAKEFGMRAVGYEINPILRIITRWRARYYGVSELVEVRGGSVTKVTLPPAELVTVYLLPALVERLKPKLVAELPGAARLVVRDFHPSDWTPSGEDGWLKMYRMEDVL